MTGERIVVYGAGGLGREVLQLVRDTKCRDGAEVLGFVDDGVDAGTIRNDALVLGNIGYFDGIDKPTSVVFGIASCRVKENIYRRLKEHPLISFPNVIHPRARVEAYTTLGEGVVMAIDTFVSIDAHIGDCVLLNGKLAVAHDAWIGAFTSVMPMAAISGKVTIGKRCLIGTMSAIHQGITIGDDCTVGMGSIVLRDIPDGATVLGNPAKRIS